MNSDMEILIFPSPGSKLEPEILVWGQSAQGANQRFIDLENITVNDAEAN